MSRRRYEAYRDSGVEWLGEVPAHWGVERLKFATTYQTSSVDKKAFDDEVPVRLCNYTDVYYRDRILASDGEFMEATATTAELQRFRLRVGDVLITKDSEDWRDIAVPALVEETADDFVCGYHLGIFRGDRRMHAPYLLRVLQSEAVNQQFQVASTGVTRFGMPNAAAGNALLPLPPIEEQRDIAGFLDRETSRVDALIEKKRLLIERIEEQRTALISRTVTRGLPPEAARAAGLDPSPRLKPSGVEWLGDVPEHWEVDRLGHRVTKVGSGKTPRGGGETYVSAGVLLIRSQNVQNDGLSLADAAYIEEHVHDQMRGTSVCPGDVLLNITGASLGRSSVAPPDLPAANVNQHVCIIRPMVGRVASHYLHHALLSKPVQAQIFVSQVGSSREGLNFEEVKTLWIAFPPNPEQAAIVEWLGSELAKFAGVSRATERAIERLQEYRTAIITAAVTGKIDVRESACEDVAAG